MYAWAEFSYFNNEKKLSAVYYLSKLIVNSRTESAQFIGSCVLCNDSNSVFI